MRHAVELGGFSRIEPVFRPGQAYGAQSLRPPRGVSATALHETALFGPAFPKLSSTPNRKAWILKCGLGFRVSESLTQSDTPKKVEFP